MTLRQDQRGFHVIPVLILLIVLGVVVFAGITVFKKNNPDNNKGSSNNPAGSGSSFAEGYKDVCKDRDVAFTSSPLKLEQLGYIRPLGAVADGHVTPTDHVYVGANNPNAADNTIPVLMPGNGTVVEVAAMPSQYIGDRSGTQVAPEDHRIVISHSCRFYSIYIHVHKLSDELKAATGNLQPNESKRISVDLKAGDTVGYIGNSTFDWTPVDTKSTLKGFITPSLYDGESWKIHTVSPFDWYKGDLKKTLEAKSLRKVAPLGGKIDYDKPGKLIGTWFREGSGGYSGTNGNNGGRYWDGHLSVVPDYIDPSSTIVSIGDWQDKAQQFSVKGDVDPAAISKNSGLVKYELINLSHQSADMNWRGNSYANDVRVNHNGELRGTIVFEVLDGEKLTVEAFPGKSASQVSGFTSAAKTYSR